MVRLKSDVVLVGIARSNSVPGGMVAVDIVSALVEGIYRVRLPEEAGAFNLAFTDDPNCAPHRSSEGMVTVGKDWLREHCPHQWAAFCAARLLGLEEFTLVRELLPEGDYEYGIARALGV